MMKKLLILSAVLSGILFSCHTKEKIEPNKPQPEDTRPYSYWTVNEDSFKTNDVEKVIGLGRCDLYSEGFTNSYSISFNIGHQLPLFGSFPIAKTSTQNPAYVHLGFYYKDSTYIISPNNNNVLIATSVNNKARYTLPPTWFIDYYNHNDSVLIQGVFNEP